ncbi:MAG: hypothetical protein ACHBN1_26695 [Heteroscytonema crispum UTEX LB 1556]
MVIWRGQEGRQSVGRLRRLEGTAVVSTPLACPLPHHKGWLPNSLPEASAIVICRNVKQKRYNNYAPTNNQQRDRASPFAWVGKTPLRPLARPQDRSGSPTKGAKLAGGNLPDCRLRAPTPTNQQN